MGAISGLKWPWPPGGAKPPVSLPSCLCLLVSFKDVGQPAAPLGHSSVLSQRPCALLGLASVSSSFSLRSHSQLLVPVASLSPSTSRTVRGSGPGLAPENWEDLLLLPIALQAAGLAWALVVAPAAHQEAPKQLSLLPQYFWTMGRNG